MNCWLGAGIVDGSRFRCQLLYTDSVIEVKESHYRQKNGNHKQKESMDRRVTVRGRHYSRNTTHRDSHDPML